MDIDGTLRWVLWLIFVAFALFLYFSGPGQSGVGSSHLSLAIEVTCSHWVRQPPLSELQSFTPSTMLEAAHGPRVRRAYRSPGGTVSRVSQSQSSNRMTSHAVSMQSQLANATVGSAD